MRTLKLILEYDGTDFVGWQRQAEGVSIQGLLEDVLVRFEGSPVTVHGAGRTDAGVHALGQVASVTLNAAHDLSAVQRALNAGLPRTVRVLSVEEAALDFHARFSARSKSYEYRIVNEAFVSPFLHRYVWHVPAALDVSAMRAAAEALKGRHDFAAFQGAGSDVTNTERTILGSDLYFPTGWENRDLTPVVFRITGDGFLRHMVRTIVGTLVEVGLGHWPPGRVPEILAGRDRTQAGPTAPARGLFLMGVQY